MVIECGSERARAKQQTGIRLDKNPPKAGKDKVDLDKDGSKRQQAAHRRDRHGTQVPRPARDGTRDALHPARVVAAPRPVSPQHRPQQTQRAADKHPDHKDDDDRSERRRHRRVVEDGNRVEREGDGRHRQRKQVGRQQHRLNPRPPVVLRVQTSRHISPQQARQRVEHDEERHHRAATDVQLPGDRHRDRQKRQRRQLDTRTHDGRKKLQHHRRPKHVTVHELPARLLVHIPLQRLEVV